jgi:predicted RND superfamily exporter protein
VQKGTAIAAALPEAASDVGSSLAIAAATTAVAFYSFVPTDFDGISELGVIAGTGMFISLITTFTLLPALLVVLPRKTWSRTTVRTWTLDRVLRPITSRGTAVIAVALAVGVTSVILLGLVRFDSNPINLRDSETESVKTYLELQTDTRIGRLTLKLLSPRPDVADLKSKLASLPLVEAVASLQSLVPPDLEEMLMVLLEVDMAL